jgi:hypothetical protein
MPTASAVERLHRDAKAVVLLVQQAVAADDGTLDHDVVRRRRIEPELLLVASHPHVLRVEHECADAARPRGALVGAREDQERPRVTSIRDPLLCARDAPAVALRVGARAQGARVGAGFRLGERERAQLVAARERRDEARALLVGAEGEERQRHRARVHGHGHPHAGVRP